VKKKTRKGALGKKDIKGQQKRGPKNPQKEETSHVDRIVIRSLEEKVCEENKNLQKKKESERFVPNDFMGVPGKQI